MPRLVLRQLCFCRPTLLFCALLAIAAGNVSCATTVQPSISGPVWQWVQTRNNNDTRTTPPKPERYTVQFLANGQLKAKADCNQKGGTYVTDGKRLTIKIITSTMAACEPGSLEEPFVRNLTAAAGYFLRDGDLYIDLKYDSGTMTFTTK